MTQQTSARRATSILEVWRHGLPDVCWYLRILHVACRGFDVYKGRLNRLLLSPLDQPSKPTAGSIKSKHRTLGQLDTHNHDHSISISSEPRSPVALRRERGPDTHIFLPASTRARISYKRISASSLDQFAHFSIYQHTNTRQSPRISALLAAIRYNH
jgi:hypothetical protein